MIQIPKQVVHLHGLAQGKSKHRSAEDSQQARSGPLLGQFVTRIAQRTVLQGKAATADAEVQLVAHASGELDLFLQRLLPGAAYFLPIRFGRNAVGWQILKGRFDLLQRKAQTLSHLDETEDAKLAPGEASLVPFIADAAHQPLGFVKMDCRNGDAAASGQLTDGQHLLFTFLKPHAAQLTSSEIEVKCNAHRRFYS